MISEDEIKYYRGLGWSWHSIAKRFNIHPETLRKQFGDIPRNYEKGPRIPQCDVVSSYAPIVKSPSLTKDERHLALLRSTGKYF